MEKVRRAAPSETTSGSPTDFASFQAAQVQAAQPPYTTEQLVHILASASTLQDIIASDALEANRAKYSRILPSDTALSKEDIYRVAQEQGCSRDTIDKILAIYHPTAADHKKTLENLDASPSQEILCKTAEKSYHTTLEAALRSAMPLDKIQTKIIKKHNMSTLQFYRHTKVARSDWKRFIPGINETVVEKQLLGSVTLYAYQARKLRNKPKGLYEQEFYEKTVLITEIHLHKQEFTNACADEFKQLEAAWEPYRETHNVTMHYTPTQLPHLKSD
jgi:hypothetical protein